jgi:aminoglycoside/hydroxyurea antibiotic resistance kinase
MLRYGFGAEGTCRLADLPRQIAAPAREWGLRVGPAFDQDGAASWVAPMEWRDGSEAVLKITFPHDEPRFEAHALRVLDGRGAVRLLRASADGFSLLLERCRPGTDLWSLSEAEGNVGLGARRGSRFHSKSLDDRYLCAVLVVAIQLGLIRYAVLSTLVWELADGYAGSGLDRIAGARRGHGDLAYLQCSGR